MIYLLTILAFFLGWWSREVLILLKSLQTRLNELKMPVKKDSEDKPKASFAEPLDPLEFAAAEEQRRIAKLNQ